MEYHEEPDWHTHVDAAKRPWFEELLLKIGVDAESMAPVDTGRLKQSIEVDAHGDVGRVGSPLDYSLYVEEGHRVAYKDPTTGETVFTGDVVPPQPFLRPALYGKRGG